MTSLAEPTRTALSTATLFAHFARQLAGETTVSGVVERLVSAAVDCVPHADVAGVSACTRRSIVTLAHTDPLLTQIDELQRHTHEGPTWEIERNGRTCVLVEDLAADQTWPTFAPHAVARNVRSALAVALDGAGPIVGALTLYSSKAGAFSAEAPHLARLLAIHASIAIGNINAEVNLNIAVENRDRIGQAKGILMERYKITENEAFDLLACVSQRRHVKLREVAETLCVSGNLLD